MLLTADDSLFHRADGIFPRTAQAQLASFRFRQTTGFFVSRVAQHCQQFLPGDAIPAKRFDILVVCRDIAIPDTALVFIAARGIRARWWEAAEGDFKALFAAGVLPAIS